MCLLEVTRNVYILFSKLIATNCYTWQGHDVHSGGGGRGGVVDRGCL